MSKLILFDFQCTDCDKLAEELVRSDVHEISCPECGGKALRQISGTHLDYRLGVQSSSFPTLADKWARMQVEKSRTDKGSLCDGAPNLKTY